MQMEIIFKITLYAVFYVWDLISTLPIAFKMHYVAEFVTAHSVNLYGNRVDISVTEWALY